ncbi:hypothetical protein [Streptomyces sp. NPDC005549]|uniref:hypothetical protein n=1 Tax=Streptomyces sp. NPDC005549 TaxID=3154888 RepID=UPI00339E4D0F
MGLRVGKQRQTLGRLQRIDHIREPETCTDALGDTKLRLEGIGIATVRLEALLVPPLVPLPLPLSTLGQALHGVRAERTDHDAYQSGQLIQENHSFSLDRFFGAARSSLRIQGAVPTRGPSPPSSGASLLGGPSRPNFNGTRSKFGGTEQVGERRQQLHG